MHEGPRDHLKGRIWGHNGQVQICKVPAGFHLSEKENGKNGSRKEQAHLNIPTSLRYGQGPWQGAQELLRVLLETWGEWAQVVVVWCRPVDSFSTAVIEGAVPRSWINSTVLLGENAGVKGLATVQLPG